MIRSPRMHDYDAFLVEQRARIRSRLKNRHRSLRGKLTQLAKDSQGDLVAEMRGAPQASDRGREADILSKVLGG